MLQPHTSAFLKMSNHQAVMETELRHYSAITRGKLSHSLSPENASKRVFRLRYPVALWRGSCFLLGFSELAFFHA